MNRKTSRMKQGLSAALATTLLTMAVACQPTPDKPPVVNRSEGLPAGAIISPFSKGESRTWDLPETLKLEKDYMRDTLQIRADLPLDLVPPGSMPLLELEKKSLDRMRLEALCSYFSDGRKLYKRPQKTKPVLRARLEAEEKLKNEFAADNSELISRIKDVLENAPEAEPAREYWNDILKALEANEKNDPKEAELLQVRIENEVGLTEEIRVVKDTGASGDVLFDNFRYTRGFVESEEDYQHLSNQNKDQLRRWGGPFSFGANKTYLDFQTAFLQRFRQALDRAPVISEKEAKAKADRLLKELGINGPELEFMGRSLWFQEENVFDVSFDDFSQAKTAVLLIYTNQTAKLPSFKLPAIITLQDNLPEQTYAPPFQPERIRIVVTDEGVQYFAWENMCKQTKIIAENLKLMPFSEILERLSEHMHYSAIAGLKFNGMPEDKLPFIARHQLVSVRLEAMNVTAYEAPKNAWLIPVWNFVFEEYRSNDLLGENVYFNTSNILLSALDGGFVKPSNAKVGN